MAASNNTGTTTGTQRLRELQLWKFGMQVGNGSFCSSLAFDDAAQANLEITAAANSTSHSHQAGKSAKGQITRNEKHSARLA
jgi:hypothetical protein